MPKKTLADILLIWKCNLPKDITGMEINTAITGWDRGLMRILARCGSWNGSAEIGWLVERHSVAFKVDFISVIQWGSAPRNLQNGVMTPWKWYDSCLRHAKGRIVIYENWTASKTGSCIKDRRRGAQSILFSLFFVFFSRVALAAQEIHSSLSFLQVQNLSTNII